MTSPLSASAAGWGKFGAVVVLLFLMGGWVALAEQHHKTSEQERKEFRENLKILNTVEIDRQNRAKWEAEQKGYVPPVSSSPPNLPEGYTYCPGKPNKVCDENGRELR